MIFQILSQVDSSLIVILIIFKRERIIFERLLSDTTKLLLMQYEYAQEMLYDKEHNKSALMITSKQLWI